MGQKTHPIGFRLGIVKTWSSKWYEEKQYAKWLHEDIRLKREIKKKLEQDALQGPRLTFVGDYVREKISKKLFLP